MKVRDVIKLIEADGWKFNRMNGSHRQFNHLDREGLVTVGGNKGDDVLKGTLNSILKQVGLK